MERTCWKRSQRKDKGDNEMLIGSRIEEIRDKYNLREDIDDLCAVEEYLKIWIENTSTMKDGKVALYGAGQHTKALVLLLRKHGEDRKIGYLIDNYAEDRIIDNIPVIREKEIPNKEIDMVFISSWIYRDEFKVRMHDDFPNVNTVEPYSILDKRLKKRSKNSVWQYCGPEKYKWFIQRQKEKKKRRGTERAKICRQLIAGYYEIYDWVDLEEEISDYVIHREEKWNMYSNLLREIHSLHEEMLLEIKRKESKSYMVYLVDAMSKSVVDDMPFLCSLRSESITFEKYRNEYPGTREVMMGLLTGWRPFEDETYKERRVDVSSSELLFYMDKNNIKTSIISRAPVQINYREINNYEGYHEDSLISEVIFHGITKLLNEQDSQLIIMHSYDTIHTPHFYPTSEIDAYDGISAEEYRIQFKNAVLYTDKILRYYINILKESKNVIQIVMGDHGINIDWEYELFIAKRNLKIGIWDMKQISPELIIYEPDGIAEEINGLISTNEFCNILEVVIKGEKKDFSKFQKKNLPLEYVPFYNKASLVQNYRLNAYTRGLGLKGIMNDDYMYLYLEDGDKRYYRINGCELQLLDSEVEIAGARNSIGEKEIDECVFPQGILKDPFFDDHNHYYLKNETIGSVSLTKNGRLVIENIDLEITEKCTLKCQSCNNCMQYYKNPQNITLETIEQSLKKLSGVMEIKDLRILGGEPFIHPQLDEIVNFSCKMDNIKAITIYTNATILPDDRQLQSFINPKVTIIISDYNLIERQKTKELESKLQKHNIAYSVSGIRYWYDPGEIKNNQLNENELKFMQRNCRGRDCATLLKGKVYRCEMLANATNLGLIPHDEENYIELQREDNVEQALKKYFLREYYPGCKWCNATWKRIEPAIQK